MAPRTRFKTFVAFWAATAKDPSFFGVSYWILVPLSFFLLHMRAWTFYMVIASAIFLVVMNRFGFSPVTLARTLRARLAGKVVTPRYQCGRKTLNK